MRAPRLPRDEEHPQRPAEQPAPPDHAVLALQQSAGNQATGRMLQRVGIMDVVAPGLEIGFEWTVWRQFVKTVRESASYQTIPSEWRQLAGQYSREHPEDGAWIRMGIMRMPDFYLGGWLVDEAGSETHAI